MSEAPTFKLVPAPTFEADVGLSLPGGGQATVRLVFRHQGRAALKRWIDGAGDLTDAAFLSAVIAGWRGVHGPQDEAVPFTPEALEALLDAYPSAGSEVFEAYLNELTQGRRKNSNARPVTP